MACWSGLGKSASTACNVNQSFLLVLPVELRNEVWNFINGKNFCHNCGKYHIDRGMYYFDIFDALVLPHM